MKTLLVNDELHRRWKVFCSKKGIQMTESTELALELAMKSKKIK